MDLSSATDEELKAERVSERLKLEDQAIVAAVFVGLFASVLYSLPILIRGYDMQMFLGMLSISVSLKAIGGIVVAANRKDFNVGIAFFVGAVSSTMWNFFDGKCFNGGEAMGAVSSTMWNFFYITTLTKFSYLYSIPVATQLLFDGFFFGGLSMVIAWYALSRFGVIKKSYSLGELG